VSPEGVPLAVDPQIEALFKRDAPVLRRVAMRQQVDLGISIAAAVKRTLAAWTIARAGELALPGLSANQTFPGPARPT
jgi:hypothetical protein